MKQQDIPDPAKPVTGEPVPPPRTHAELMRQLHAPLFAMTPTPFMGVCLAIGLAAFLWTVCFVAYNDYDRSHPGSAAPEKPAVQP